MDGPATVTLHRDTHLFASQPRLVERLEERRRRVVLAPEQLVHVETPAIYLVRLGRLRVSEFLDDGREITRAVLQAGAMFRTAEPGAAALDAAADAYDLSQTVLMALGEAELWILPPDEPLFES